MELNEQLIKESLRKKGVTAKTMCKTIGLTETSLYRFYQNGGMRVSTEKKIKEYLGLNASESVEEVKYNDVLSGVAPGPGVDTNLVDRLLKRIEELSIENFRLKEKLGKYDSTLYALTA